MNAILKPQAPAARKLVVGPVRATVNHTFKTLMLTSHYGRTVFDLEQYMVGVLVADKDHSDHIVALCGPQDGDEQTRLDAKRIACMDETLRLLNEADAYLCEIRAGNLDGSETALGKLLDRITEFRLDKLGA